MACQNGSDNARESSWPNDQDNEAATQRPTTASRPYPPLSFIRLVRPSLPRPDIETVPDTFSGLPTSPEKSSRQLLHPNDRSWRPCRRMVAAMLHGLPASQSSLPLLARPCPLDFAGKPAEPGANYQHQHHQRPQAELQPEPRAGLRGGGRGIGHRMMCRRCRQSPSTFFFCRSCPATRRAVPARSCNEFGRREQCDSPSQESPPSLPSVDDQRPSRILHTSREPPRRTARMSIGERGILV